MEMDTRSKLSDLDHPDVLHESPGSTVPAEGTWMIADL